MRRFSEKKFKCRVDVGANGMRTHYQEIARLKTLGYTTQQISTELNLPSTTVNKISNNPLVKNKIATLSANRDVDIMEIKREVDQMLPLALDALREGLETENISAKDKANLGLSVLGLAGIVAPKNVNIHSITRRITNEDITELKRRANI